MFVLSVANDSYGVRSSALLIPKAFQVLGFVLSLITANTIGLDSGTLLNTIIFGVTLTQTGLTVSVARVLVPSTAVIGLIWATRPFNPIAAWLAFRAIVSNST
ncbi:hypothetical protein ACJBXR_05445 [Streptococcus suis]